jgi:DNA topoisomerase-2
MKVAQLAGYCAEVSNYHHGEQCLYDTITKMSQDYPGSNNVAYFVKDGQFGSRSYGGKDAANARYIFTKCGPITRLLFPEQDDHLLDYTLDDGDKVEPDYYLPILPTILGNGCTAGIGTGWSCSVPCFDFKQLASSVIAWLDSSGEDFHFELLPFYFGFKGTIEKISDNKYQSIGILKEILPTGRKKQKLYEITELPIGCWINKYKEELEQMMEAKKIKSIKNYSSPDSVHFIVEPSENFVPDLDNMKLRSVILSSNMVLFTEGSKLRKFADIREIFEIFCKKRLGLYTKRKSYLTEQINIQLTLDKNKKRFIEEVENESLKIFRVKERDIIMELKKRKFERDPRMKQKTIPCIESGQIHHLDEDLDQEGISTDFNYLLNIPMKDVSHEKINELDVKIKKLENELRDVNNRSEKEMWKLDLDNFLSVYNTIYS